MTAACSPRFPNWYRRYLRRRGGLFVLYLEEVGVDVIEEKRLAHDSEIALNQQFRDRVAIEEEDGNGPLLVGSLLCVPREAARGQENAVVVVPLNRASELVDFRSPDWGLGPPLGLKCGLDADGSLAKVAVSTKASILSLPRTSTERKPRCPSSSRQKCSNARGVNCFSSARTRVLISFRFEFCRSLRLASELPDGWKLVPTAGCCGGDAKEAASRSLPDGVIFQIPRVEPSISPDSTSLCRTHWTRLCHLRVEGLLSRRSSCSSVVNSGNLSVIRG